EVLRTYASNRRIRWDIQRHPNHIQTTSKRHPEVLIKWADSAVSLLGRTGCRGPTPLKPHRHPVFGEIHEVPHFRRVSVKHLWKPKAEFRRNLVGFSGSQLRKVFCFQRQSIFPSWTFSTQSVCFVFRRKALQPNRISCF